MDTRPPIPEIMATGPVPAMDWVIVLPVVLLLMGAALLLALRRRRHAGLAFSVLVLVAVIGCELTLFLRVMEEGPVAMTMGSWLPPFGISFAADAFGAGFALVSAFVTLMVLFSMGAEPERDDRFSLVLLLLAGMTGAFLTGDAFNLYVWFEVTLIASFGLLVLGGRPIQIDAAVKYGFLNFLATTLFLLALGLTYGLTGTLNMADLIGRAETAEPAVLAGIVALLILAFGLKAAAFPLNAWLPAAYHAPPAWVSALFAGLLTKLGAFALLRVLTLVFPQMGALFAPLLAALAIATLLIAPLGAIAETNLRRAVGFFVIGGIGVVLAGLALPGEAGATGAGLYIVNAILAMTGLYLVVGLVERATGETDTSRMGGLYAGSAPLSILFFILVLAAAGMPPLLGFWPKLVLVEAGLARAGEDWLAGALVGALLVNSALTLIAGSRLWAHVFWRAAPDEPAPLTRPPVSGLLAGAALALAILGAGLFPALPLSAARAGAADSLDPARYIAAVGLAPDTRAGTGAGTGEAAR